eukprot:15834150-Heterocapsa_arctica.AAC.1
MGLTPSCVRRGNVYNQRSLSPMWISVGSLRWLCSVPLYPHARLQLVPVLSWALRKPPGLRQHLSGCRRLW